MRKIFVLTALAVLMLGACKKKDISPDKGKDPEVEQGDFSFKLDFTFKEEYASIKLGDLIWINLTITDSKPEKNVVYRLYPVGNDATKHQIMMDDYSILIKNPNPKTPSQWYKEVKYVEVKDISETNSFIIKPEVAGTFQLEFSLQKYDTIQKKFIGNQLNTEFRFNVVQFFIESASWSKGFWPILTWYRNFGFRIYDGNREYDDYLQEKGIVLKHEYKAEYDGLEKSGDFKENERREFRDEWSGNKESKLQNFPPTMNITITQYLQNGTKNVIVYKNVPVY